MKWTMKTLLLTLTATGIILLGSLQADDKKKPAPEYGKKLDKVDVTPKEW